MENRERIRELLDKYLEGLTTSEEETFLKDFFGQESVPAEFKSDALWFGHITNKAANEEEVQTLERDMSQWIDKQNQHEKRVSLRIWSLRIAAGVALLIAGAFLVRHYQSEKMKDTYQDPQIAYLEAKKVLLYVSQTLNKGTDKLQTVSRIQSGSNEMSIFSTFGSGLKNLELVSKYGEETIEKQ